jgi:superfamily I DNA/RNA helicase
MTQDLMTSVEEFWKLSTASPVTADVEEGDAEPMEAYQASEYLVYVQAFDVYSRHLEKTIEFKIVALQARRDQALEVAAPMDDSGRIDEFADLDKQLNDLMAHQENPVDKVVEAGVRLLKRLDAEMDEFARFMSSNLPDQLHAKLNRTIARPARDPQGAALRARGLRGVLSRGGPNTLKGVFGKNMKLRKQVQTALAAVQMEDSDKALDMLAAIPVKHALIRKWIDMAAEAAQPLKEESFFPEFLNPVEAGASEISTNAETLAAQEAKQLGSVDPAEVQEAQAAQSEVLARVEQEATAKAREALEKAGEPDVPPVKSEVVGIATAAALTAVTDNSNPQNIPDTLKPLDDEQRLAAMTDGKVLVAASAGSGKTRTAVARISHLVLDRGVPPLRILATTFNAKAGEELAERLAPTLGEDTVKQMRDAGKLGTMHKVFRNIIKQSGNFNEQIAISKPAFQKDGSRIGRAVNRVWGACYGKDRVPKLKEMMRYKSQWAGNDVSPQQALKEATDRKEQVAAKWYEWYEQFKKGNPRDWSPPCEEKQKRSNKGPTQWERYLNTVRTVQVKGRPQVVPVGDFDDMLSMARDILRRNPEARKAIQSSLDHVIVDECQDLNSIQHEVIKYLTEHVSDDGSDGRSLWMVGDDKQSIYGFRGARPDKFIALDADESFTTRMIRTNYRSEPEIIDAANKLISNNSNQIQMDANANPARERGNGSIRVERPKDEAQAAISVADRVKSAVDRPDGDNYTDHAVLTRTNAELNAYETASIIRGIPYQRKGGGGFLNSPETKAVLGYVDLVEGTDFEAQQNSFAAVIDTPNRFFRGTDGPDIIKAVFQEYAKYTGEDRKSISPMKALNDPMFVQMAAKRLAKTAGGVRHAGTALDDLRENVMMMQLNASEKGATVHDLFNEILELEGRTMTIDPDTGRAQWHEMSLRESIQGQLKDSDEEEDDGEDESLDSETVADVPPEALGLGNVTFLYKLATVDPTDPEDIAQDPNTPAGFQAKMGRYQERAKGLRVPTEAERRAAEYRGETLPEGPKDFMSLNTVHSTKGLEWKNVYVPMPSTKFPISMFGSKEEEDLEELAIVYQLPPLEGVSEGDAATRQLEDERRLGYVAITRAGKNLTVICPERVDGKKADPSSFVMEAGLVMGENIVPPGDGAEAAVEVNEVTKTASGSDEDWYYGDDDVGGTKSAQGGDPVTASAQWSKDVDHG